jgi:hypothetical protein
MQDNVSQALAVFKFAMKWYRDVKLAIEMAGDHLDTEAELDEFKKIIETLNLES